MKLHLNLPDTFSEMMVANVDMLSLRMHHWNLIDFKDARVILKSMAKNVNARAKNIKVELLLSSFAKSIRGITSLSVEGKEIYSALVVLRATCDCILEAQWA